MSGIWYSDLKAVFTHGNWREILEGMQRRERKIIKRIKDFSYRERLEKIGLTTLLERRMRDDLIEIFKIMEFLIMTDIF